MNLASRFTPLHPAVLRLIKRTVDVGGEHQLDVTVCGEIASQPLMAIALIGLGVNIASFAILSGGGLVLARRSIDRSLQWSGPRTRRLTHRRPTSRLLRPALLRLRNLLARFA